MSLTAELDERIIKCNKILEQNPNSQIFAALAEAYRKKGELDKAFRSCQNGLRIHPNYASGHMVMARINFDKGLYDWAEIEVLKATELEGLSHASELLLAEIYLYRGEAAKATKILNRLSIVDQSNPQIVKLLQVAQLVPQEKVKKIEPVSRPASTVDTGKPHESKSAEKICVNELIDQVEAISGVGGILLINSEGLVAESRWEDSASADLFGAIACDVVRTVKSQIEMCNFGQYESIFIEAKDMIINIIALKDNLLLVKTNNQINLGTLRLKLSALLSRLSEDFSLSKGMAS